MFYVVMLSGAKHLMSDLWDGSLRSSLRAPSLRMTTLFLMASQLKKMKRAEIIPRLVEAATA